MTPIDDSRRKFIKNSIAGITAFSAGAILPGFSAKSYGNILGANDRIKVAVMGVNSRGNALAVNFALQKNCQVNYISDVDSRAADQCAAKVMEVGGKKPRLAPDFRKALEDKDVDALVVAAPDHWHAPAAILACQAGKHVYLEKPCSHSPHEGELVIAAAEKYKRQVQMGNQRRSWPNVATAVEEIRQGVIGRPYFAKGWYSNNRGSIGTGKKVAVPGWLDFELWQGPAPRRPYQDNLIHYNWHWFWHWGTGEALNNGTHMADLMRWALGVTYPIRVSSAGGRYRYQDDWETPDTQVINLEFDNNTAMTWEGRSCNGRSVEGSSVGVAIYGEKGTVVIGAGNAYKLYDLKNNLIKEVENEIAVDPLNRSNPSQLLDAFHIQNFFDAIRRGVPLKSDIVGGHQSTLLMQLGNIAQRTGRTLKVDPSNGHILQDPAAMELWKREYEPGWEPVV
ncbi:MAG: Gfo/Idh/MocA family oxidoreductase [Solitalea sp.]